MRKVRSWQCILLIAFLLLGSCLPALATNPGTETSFTDIQEHWAVESINKWADRGLTKGYPDGTFQPGKGVTRAEFMTWANTAFGYSQTAPINFTDVWEKDWFAPEVAKAQAVGYISGYPDGTVKPNNSLSRQEVAVILANILEPKGTTVNSAGKFTDSADIPAWSKSAINAIVNSGYMKGYPDGTFKPAQPMTRAEALTVLDNAVGVLYDKAGTYGEDKVTTITGNVTISTSGITLQNTIIDGNLYLTEGIGTGNATLKNVDVKGATKIAGGGEDSIIIIDSDLGLVIVNVPDQHLVRLVAQGTSTIGVTDLITPAILEESELSAAGFEGVNLQVPPGATVKLLGDFQEVNVETPEVQLDIQKGTVQKLTLAPATQGTTVNLAQDAKIETFTTHSAAKVTGEGTIETANINADGVTLEKEPTKANVAEGVKTTIAGETVEGTEVFEPPVPTPTPAEDTDEEDEPRTVRVSAISVKTEGDVNAVITEPSGTLQLKANVSPAGASNKRVTWSVDDERIATISETGVLTAVADGTITVTATAKDGSGKKGELDVAISGQKAVLVENDEALMVALAVDYKETIILDGIFDGFTVTRGIRIEGGTIKVESAENIPGSIPKGIYIQTNDNVEVVGVSFIGGEDENGQRKGIVTESGYTVDVTVSGCTFEDLPMGVYFNPSAKGTIEGNTFTSMLHAAIGIASAEDVTITGNTVTDTVISVEIFGNDEIKLDEVLEGNGNTFPEGSQVIGDKILVLQEKTVYNKNSGGVYDTIQAAVEAAQAGDTILVGTGEYEGGINFDDKRLTLVGSGSGSDSPSTIISNEGIDLSGTGLKLAPGDPETVRTTVRNLHVKGFNFGIQLASYTEIDNVTVSGNNCGFEIHGPGNSIKKYHDLIIKSSIATDNKVGFKIATTANVEGLDVDNCKFDGNTEGWDFAISTKEGLLTTVDNVRVTKTTFNSNSRKGIYVEKLNNALFEGVQIKGSGVAEVYQFNAGMDINLKYGKYSNIQLKDVVVEDSGRPATDGDDVRPGITISARDDDGYATNPASLVGVTLENVAVNGSGAGMVFAGNISNVTVKNCSITGNTICGLANATSKLVTATDNYWGHESGPRNSLSNPNGQGNAVSENVVFFPWYMDEALTELSPYGEGIINARTRSSYLSIQAAINEAAPGDTILISEGIYNQDLTIGVENLTLKSTTGADATTINGHIVIESDNVTIDGFGINAVQEKTPSIKLEGVKNTSIKNCKFDGSGTENIIAENHNAIEMPSAGKDKREGVIIDNCHFSNGYYVTINGYADDVTVKDSTITNCKAGVNLQWGKNLVVENTDIDVVAQAPENNSYCVRFASAGANTGTNMTINGGTFVLQKDGVEDPIEGKYHSAIIVRAGVTGDLSITGATIDGEVVDLSGKLGLESVLENNTFPEGCIVIGNKIRKPTGEEIEEAIAAVNHHVGGVINTNQLMEALQDEILALNNVADEYGMNYVQALQSRYAEDNTFQFETKADIQAFIDEINLAAEEPIRAVNEAETVDELIEALSSDVLFSWYDFYDSESGRGVVNRNRAVYFVRLQSLRQEGEGLTTKAGIKEFVDNANLTPVGQVNLAEMVTSFRSAFTSSDLELDLEIYNNLGAEKIDVYTGMWDYVKDNDISFANAQEIQTLLDDTIAEVIGEGNTNRQPYYFEEINMETDETQDESDEEQLVDNLETGNKEGEEPVDGSNPENGEKDEF